jgi:hypothetical protein
LEAIELVLFPRGWFQFFDTDFYVGVVGEPIVIEATVGDLPRSLTTQAKFGLQLRGWTHAGALHDEPDDEDEPVLTVRMRVDAALEPAWQVVTDRDPEGRMISARDRELLGAIRLGEDVERQLSWARGSSLARVTEDPEALGAALSEAHRTARESLRAANLPDLTRVAELAGDAGVEYGAQLKRPLKVAIDPRSLNVGSAALGLHQSDGVPVRAAGLGSRRLLALAIQKQARSTSVVALADEIEHGLEPHRLRHLLTKLRRDGLQVLMTSHSETAVAELGVSCLGIVRASGNGSIEVKHPDVSLQDVIRKMPEAVLSRRVIICEGATEFGLSRGLVAAWDAVASEPLACRGVVFVNGEGKDHAAQRAVSFKSLGYDCCFWADSDQSTTPSVGELRTAGVRVIQWADELCTEQRLALDLPYQAFPELWTLAAEGRGSAASVSDQLANHIGHSGARPPAWEGWASTYPEESLRTAFGTAAAKSGWYKRTTIGESLGALIANYVGHIPNSDLSTKLTELHDWCYDGN